MENTIDTRFTIPCNCAMTVDQYGNLPSQIERNGKTFWLYRLQETIHADDGNGGTAFITIYEEKAYLSDNKVALEWWNNHPRHYSKRNDYGGVELEHWHRNGEWIRVHG